MYTRLAEFHALGTSLISASPSTVIRHTHGPSQPYDHLSIDQELHRLFIYISRIGVEADRRGQYDQARWILFALYFALDKYPGLVDWRKGHVLLKIALILQRLGHRWESEQILVKVASMYGFSPLVPNPCYLLACSFADSSEVHLQKFGRTQLVGTIWIRISVCRLFIVRYKIEIRASSEQSCQVLEGSALMTVHPASITYKTLQAHLPHQCQPKLPTKEPQLESILRKETFAIALPCFWQSQTAMNAAVML